MLKKIGVSIVMLTLVTTACSKKTTQSQNPGDNASGGKNYTVQVDMKKDGQKTAASKLGYYPDNLKIHAGDTVEYTINWSGDPHTVTFGTLVDAAIAKLPAKPSDNTPEPTELAGIPTMFPEGPGPSPYQSSNPCFVKTGSPSKATCNSGNQPAFDGSYAEYSSGFLAPTTSFTMETSKSLAAKSYGYFCTLHRLGMKGTVTIVAASVTIPSPDEVTAQADKEIDADAATAASAAAKIANGLGPLTTAAGFFDEQSRVAVNVFGPAEQHVKVGQVAKWMPFGFHIVAFNPPQDVVETPLVKDNDGHWVANPKFGAPAGGAKPAIPSKKTGNIGEGGTWNGEGFYSSGALPGFGPPGFLTFQMKFGKAGTYKYTCTVHPDMEGTVVVS